MDTNTKSNVSQHVEQTDDVEELAEDEMSKEEPLHNTDENALDNDIITHETEDENINTSDNIDDEKRKCLDVSEKQLEPQIEEGLSSAELKDEANATGETKVSYN